jgi:hypothetical protein
MTSAFGFSNIVQIISPGLQGKAKWDGKNGNKNIGCEILVVDIVAAWAMIELRGKIFANLTFATLITFFQ